MASNDNGEKIWKQRRSKILFFGGLAGVFIYLALVEMFNAVFHLEFLLGFLAMMGVGLAQEYDRK